MMKINTKIKVVFCLLLTFLMISKISVNASSDNIETKQYLEFDSNAVYFYDDNRSLSELPYTTSTVYTPNGSGVNVKTYLLDFPDEEINYHVNFLYPNYYPDATLISPPTRKYNCHSYAWYSQNSVTNSYWMPSPTQYYTDFSYEAVDTPRIGDIICYFDDNGTPNNLADDDNLHSGIVESINSIQLNNVCGTSSRVNVISKWGAEGLFFHRGDYCPYTSTFGGAADYVKYYRPRTNDSYTLSQYSPTETIPLSINGLGSNIIDKYGMYELNVNYQKNYQVNVSSSYSLDVRLYDEHMQVLINNPTNTYSSGTYTVSISQNLSVGRYYLRLAYQNTSNSGNITVQIVGHTHLYTNSYTWLNYNQHRSFCVCGSNRLEVHAVAAKSLGDDLEYLTCILCGGPANAGIVPWDKGIQITNNGSFISPNGILVLADEDIESFLSGEIVFEYDDIEVSRNIDVPPYLLRKDEDYLS